MSFRSNRSKKRQQPPDSPDPYHEALRDIDQSDSRDGDKEAKGSPARPSSAIEHLTITSHGNHSTNTAINDDDDACPTPPPIRDGRAVKSKDNHANSSKDTTTATRPSSINQDKQVKERKHSSILSSLRKTKTDATKSRASGQHENVADTIQSQTSTRRPNSSSTAPDNRNSRPNTQESRGSRYSMASGATFYADSSSSTEVSVSFHAGVDGYLRSPDPRRILFLMNESAGHMRGDVYLRFRSGPSASAAWQSGYCHIKTKDGSLRFQPSVSSTGQEPANEFEILHDELRGCKVFAIADAASRRPMIRVTALPKVIGRNSLDVAATLWKQDRSARVTFSGPSLKLANVDSTEPGPIMLELRPVSESQFDAWFAAFLCWQVVRKGQSSGDETPIERLQPPGSATPGHLPKLSSDHGHDEPYALLQKGKPRVLDITNAGRWHTPFYHATCSLRGDGELKVESLDTESVILIQVSQLPRNAIRHLAKSVMGAPRAIVIYPNPARTEEVTSHLQPIVLSFAKKANFESWLYMLKHAARPDFLQPSVPQTSDYESFISRLKPTQITTDHGPSLTYRLRRKLTLSNVETDFHDKTQPFVCGTEPTVRSQNKIEAAKQFYVDVMVDCHVWARTSIQRSETAELSWKDFVIVDDIPLTASKISLRVRRRASATTQSGIDAASSDDPEDDVICGEALLIYNHIDTTLDTTMHMPMYDESGEQIGTIGVTCHFTQEPLLSLDQYTDVTSSLRTVSGALALKLYARQDFHNGVWLAVLLLDIFQAFGDAESWFKFLIKHEIGLMIRCTQVLRLPASSSSRKPAQQEYPSSESHNTLFRGNMLVTCALDEYMKRLGHDYLEQTLGPHLRAIIDEGKEAEIDPNRMIGGEYHPELNQNLDYIFDWAKNIWQAIASSANRLPMSLCRIFASARTAAVNVFRPDSPQALISVTAFLFLRFINPAITTPHFFDLAKSAPVDCVTRTLLHISKTINALANGTDLATKQPYMASLDGVVAGARRGLRAFVAQVCDVDTSGPSGAADLAVAMTAAREGTPLLPGLLDPSLSLATLVRWWTDTVAAAATSHNDDGTPHDLAVAVETDAKLATFTAGCSAALHAGEHAVRNTSRVSDSVAVAGVAWRGVAEEMERRPALFWAGAGAADAAAEVEEKGKKERGKAKASEEEMRRLRRTMGLM